MPEVRFEVVWPDGSAPAYYSPSLIVEEYFAPGRSYPVAEFVRLSREALAIASDRVEAKYGFPCSRSAATLAAIESKARHAGAAGDDAHPVVPMVTIRAFHR